MKYFSSTRRPDAAQTDCRPITLEFDAYPSFELYYYATVEFLYSCVARTIEHDLPREIDYLRRHDEAISRIMDRVEMPDRLAEDLVMFVRQNEGHLSKRRREEDFSKLTDAEVAMLEGIVRDAFEDFDD